MCLWFACFGLHKHDDDYYAPPRMGCGATTRPHDDRPTQPNGYGHQQYGHPQQGAHYGNGGAYRASPHNTTAGADEAGRKASNDARRGPAAHAVVAKDAAFAYTAAAAGTLKPQPAWNGRVAEGIGHGAAHAQAQQRHYYYEREPVHREAAAMDHHYYSTADHERY